MCRVCQTVYATTAGVTLLATAGVGPVASQRAPLSDHQQLPAVVAQLTPPEIKKPEWYQQQEAAEKRASQESAARSAANARDAS